ncbi:MAG: NAD-binding protein, partial [Acidobacteriota bacterium]
MGAGEVGFHLARTLSTDGHDVIVIESDPTQKERVEEEIDAAVVLGNGAEVPILQRAGVDKCDLFMAVSSHDEANLAASALAKHLGARRSVVRVGIAEDVTTHRRHYETVFGADQLLSTQLLSTTRILNHILGHDQTAGRHVDFVERLAGQERSFAEVDLAQLH